MSMFPCFGILLQLPFLHREFDPFSRSSYFSIFSNEEPTQPYLIYVYLKFVCIYVESLPYVNFFWEFILLLFFILMLMSH